MTWETARDALQWLLSSQAGATSVEFNGGEPLLAMPTLRRAVRFVEANRAPAASTAYAITTNGTLLTPEILDFLSMHRFSINISCDGVEAAQRLRGEGTFQVLDRLLDRIREGQPPDSAARVKILVTVVAATVPLLAESVRYLLGKGVRAIDVAPRLTFDPGWRASCRDELERQVDEIVRSSLEHWRRTGTVPVGFLAGARPAGAAAPMGDLLCGVAAARSVTVDPAGRAWACPLFASSLQELTPLARRASRALDLGKISTPSFSRRLAGLPRRVSRLRLFTGRLAKRSSYGRCADCEVLPECHVCPGAISHDPRNGDPDLVPDFICAFNAVTAAARRRFDEMTGGEVSAGWQRRVDGAVAAVEAAVRASLSTVPTVAGKTRAPGSPQRGHRAALRRR
jgi:sulfatase maturation enzyme AslB (radical SAM superfamily)